MTVNQCQSFLQNIQMHKKRGQPPVAEKPWKPRTQWTTDFIDRSKYKLSQTQMIQKKASLQSKHKEEAKELLEERRRKLEMGIIDEETRPIYQTALFSKNIDLNPPIRRNLSQMIEYERSRAEAAKQHSKDQKKGQLNQFQQELRQTKAFIKKVERANKQDKIDRAVEILESEQKPSKILKSEIMKQSHTTELRHEETLSKIQDTIRFMEEKLFSKNHTKKMQQSHLDISTTHYNQFLPRDNQRLITEISKKKAIPQTGNDKKKELDHLRLQFTEQKQQQQVEDDDCMDTIRRMREMIQSKQHLYLEEQQEPPQKQNIHMNINRKIQRQYEKSQSQAEIDFSLTLNNDLTQQKYEINHYGFKGAQQLQDYEEMKKSLFDEVNKLKSWSLETENKIQTNETPKQAKKIVKNTKVSQKNPELEKIKNLVNGTRKNVKDQKFKPQGYQNLLIQALISEEALIFVKILSTDSSNTQLFLFLQVSI